METTSEQEKCWLERMHSLLSWKVVSPQVNNPYEKPMGDKALLELANDLETLKKYSKARGLMDGDEIIAVSLHDYSFKASHPNLSTLMKHEIKSYFESSGLMEKFEVELKESQTEYLNEIENRKEEAAKTKPAI